MKKKKGNIIKGIELTSPRSSVEEAKDFYQSAKMTIGELRKFKENSDKTDEELEQLADGLFDLAVVVIKIIEEEERNNVKGIQ